MSEGITAQFPGVCHDCGQHYPEGTRITLLESAGWVHTQCPDDPTTARAQPGEISCPDCFLIHPEGACDR